MSANKLLGTGALIAGILTAGALALLSGCGGTSASLPTPTAKSVEYAERNGQVTTLPTLKLGRKLYIGRCGACHGLKSAKFLTPHDWPEMVARMAGNAQLTPDQQRAVTQYLVSASAAAYDTTAAAAPKPEVAKPSPAP